MLKTLSKKAKYLLVAVFAFVFSITALVIGAPKAKAATDYVDFSYETRTDSSWSVEGENTEYNNTTGDYGSCYIEIADVQSVTSSKQYKIEYKNKNNYKINKVYVSYPLNHMSNQSMMIYVAVDNGAELSGGKFVQTEMIANTGVLEFELSGEKAGNVMVFFSLSESTNRCAPKLYSNYVYEGNVIVNTGYFIRIEYTANNTVTLGKNGGTGGSDSVTATYGEAMPSATMPTRTGYSFDGYYDSVTGGTQYYTSTGASARNWDKTSDTTLYAHWTANTYTVKYNGNKPSGASGSVTNIPGNATWTYDSNATLGAAPTLTGYTFNGWYKEAACTNKVGDAGQSLNKPNLTSTKGATVNLYAKWTAKTYTVTLNKNGGTGGTNSVTATYDSAMPTSGVTMPIRVGYDFLGYYDTQATTGGTQYYTSTGASARTWNKTNNTILYARWQLKSEIQNVINKIDAIGGPNNVSYPTSKDAIVEAELAYSSLIQEHSEYANVDILVGKHNELLQDRDNYDELRDEAINNVISLIDNLGEIAYPDSKDAIVAAENAYSALDSSDKNTTVIPNYQKLLDARAEYDRQGLEKINEVIGAINAINPEIAYPKSEAELDNTNALYNALDSLEKPEVTNYDTLVGYNTTYATLREAAVNNVIALIDAISNPFDLDDYQLQIKDARTAFDNLGNNDKNEGAVTNLQKLLDAEAATIVVVQIQNIGEAFDNDEYRNKVSEAYGAYMALTDNQKAMVPDSVLDILMDDREIIDVMDIINAIGDVEYTSESKALIDAANTAYEALDDDLKDDVANYGKLVQANTDYDNVFDVVGMINVIPEFEYTPEFKEIIDNDRNAYDALTDYQKYIFPQDVLDKLLDAEKKYDAIDKITHIGKIENTKESRNRVKKAKEAYDALDEDQKQIISDEALKDLNDAVAVVDVIEEVNNVKNAGYTTKDKENIDATRTSYNALTDDQKEMFPTDALQLLSNIETAYPVMVTIN